MIWGDTLRAEFEELRGQVRADAVKIDELRTLLKDYIRAAQAATGAAPGTPARPS